MDYAKLEKEVKILQQKKNDLDISIKNLSDEKIKYLNEIPQCKKDSDNQKILVKQIVGRTNDLKFEQNKASQELKNIRSEIVIAKKELVDIRNVNDKESKKLNDGKEILENKFNDLKTKEVSVHKRELAVGERELIVVNGELELSKKISGFSGYKKDIENDEKELSVKLEIYKLKVKKHDEREAVFNENRKAYIEDSEILKNKMQTANKIIKDNEELKGSLVIKQDKLDSETKKCVEKQLSLDRNIADLQHQEKLLKIKELRIKKLAHEAGLDKELSELQEILK